MSLKCFNLFLEKAKKCMMKIGKSFNCIRIVSAASNHTNIGWVLNQFNAHSYTLFYFKWSNKSYVYMFLIWSFCSVLMDVGPYIYENRINSMAWDNWAMYLDITNCNIANYFYTQLRWPIMRNSWWKEFLRTLKDNLELGKSNHAVGWAWES